MTEVSDVQAQPIGYQPPVGCRRKNADTVMTILWISGKSNRTNAALRAAQVAALSVLGVSAGCGGTDAGVPETNQVPIYGTVSGAVQAGVTVTATEVYGSFNVSTTTDATGAYSFNGLRTPINAASITIVPQLAGYTFTPPFRQVASGTNGKAITWSNQNFTATASSP